MFGTCIHHECECGCHYAEFANCKYDCCLNCPNPKCKKRVARDLLELHERICHANG